MHSEKLKQKSFPKKTLDHQEIIGSIKLKITKLHHGVRHSHIGELVYPLRI